VGDEMKAVRGVLELLSTGGVKYIFGIPAGSVNAFFDELFVMPHINPIITKHEGAAAYMAAAYARYSGNIGVCIGCSGPGSTNLLTGAANAMREQLPVLFLTGAVPNSTVGLNASQELDAEPLFRPVTKYSVTVQKAEDLTKEVARAIEIALAGVPGPVHVAMPIDIQLQSVVPAAGTKFPSRRRIYPSQEDIKKVAARLIREKDGYLFVGQGARNAMSEVMEVAELLNWPIMTTPQAKSLVPDSHPLFKGVFGFAGHEEASSLISEGDGRLLFIVGSSLGETATNNYNVKLTAGRFVIQMDHDPSVFNRKYKVDLPVIGDVQESLKLLAMELKEYGLERNAYSAVPVTLPEAMDWNEFNTQNVFLTLQKYLPASTRYNVDIGEFMSYVIHYMKVFEPHTFNINVHFGAMGMAIGSAIGMSLADASKPIACITGDGCFFMHGMEILTAKEYNLPILFIVMNNARLGMVYHGHRLQYKRVHPRFEQQPVDISNMAKSMGIPSLRIEKMDDLKEDLIRVLVQEDGPSILEIALVDENIPPMGDRVKFLSSFGK
jgi:acetolactate synthase I/II/III large subunit